MTVIAKVILDSIAPNGARITTFELTYPRMIHSELMTHRVFSRNAASSRAIPTPKKIERIRADVAKPSEWGVNQKGMQSGGSLDATTAKLAEAIWDEACDKSLHYAEILCGLRCENCSLLFVNNGPGTECCCGDHAIKLDLHKQVANRILEPFDHITTVVTTTKLNNHWKLRLENDADGRPMADPTYFELATKWKAAFDASTPQKLEVSEWHLPYVSAVEGKKVMGVGGLVSAEDVAALTAWQEARPHDADCGFHKDWHRCACETFDSVAALKKVSVGRVARTSYMRQGQGDIAENIKLHDALAKNGHWSPFEAVATPIGGFSFKKHDDEFDPSKCGYCHRDIGDRFIQFTGFDPEPGVHSGSFEAVCKRCAQGHVTSGNFIGWHQYRKDFANEAGGD